MGQGFPDSRNVKDGAKAIKYHIDYMAWLLDHRRWLAGDVMTLADFAAAAHLSSLDYISDVDLNRSDVVKDWYAKINRGFRRQSITMTLISSLKALGAVCPQTPEDISEPEKTWTV
jgi:glutathione S-transferase